MAENNKEAQTLRMLLFEEQEKNKELEQDIKDFAFVNYEILMLFGITVKDIKENNVSIKQVVKAIKSMMITLSTNAEGMEAMFTHFQKEAERIGMKYYELAQKVSAEKKAKA